MPDAHCKLVQKAGSQYRAVAFLKLDGKRNANGYDKFHQLRPPDRNRFETRFHRWVSGGRSIAEQYHNFTKKGYRRNFQFRSDDHRLYGFLVSEKRDGFLLCVLVTHSEKHTDDTDYTILDRINVLKEEPIVKQALRDFLETDEYG